MSFSVTKKVPVLVAPAEKTPTGRLPLSFLDRLPAVNFFVEVLFVFRHGEEPARVIREALAKVLVPYYPVAGRLAKDADDGKLEVACTGEGLWFVEASARFGLEDVKYLECQPLMVPKDQLLPVLPPDVDQSEVPFYDAAGQFKIAMGEMARGLAQLTTRPLWSRDAIPSPPSLRDEIQLVHSAALTAKKFEHYTTDVSLDIIKQLQNDLSKEKGQRISVFDVVTAKLWQCRTRAIDQPPESDITLSFPANIRQELHKELPTDQGGYYRNCTFPFVVKATSGQISNGILSEIISLITEAKRSLPTKVSRFLKSEKDGKGELSMLTYGTTNLTDMRRVGFSDVDYGWGAPSHVIPVTEFKCGGFTIGFRGSHIMFDAIGGGQFKIAMGEMARGLAQPTTRPLWCRDAIPSPPSLRDEIQLVHSAALTAKKFEHYTTDVSLDIIKQLQNGLSKEKGQRISVFDAVTAKLWQCRTRAIDQPPESDVTLSFPANIRQELHKELPTDQGGYYGNCTFPFVVKATSGQIANGTLYETISLITEAKRSLPTKVSRFLKSEKDGKGELSMLTYGTTNLTDMRRVGFSDVEYGWGAPRHVIPLVDGPVNLCLIVNSPLGKKHIRLLTHCVVKEHLQTFHHELKALA